VAAFSVTGHRVGGAMADRKAAIAHKSLREIIADAVFSDAIGLPLRVVYDRSLIGGGFGRGRALGCLNEVRNDGHEKRQIRFALEINVLGALR